MGARDRTNLAILNFSATVDLLEKRPERSSAELIEGEPRSRLSFERSNVTEKFRLQVLLSTVLFHMLLRRCETHSRCVSHSAESAAEAISLAPHRACETLWSARAIKLGTIIFNNVCFFLILIVS